MSRGQDQEKIEGLKAILDKHEDFCKEMAGDKVGERPLDMLDVHCFPIWEKMVMWEKSSWGDAFSALEVKERAPTLYEYVHQVRKVPAL